MAALAPSLGQAQELCSDWSEAMVVDARQRTLVAGSAADNRILEWDGGHAHFGDFAVARLKPDGARDLSFGDRGLVRLDVGDFDSVKALVVQGSKLLAAGTTARQVADRSGPRDIVVFRVDEQGSRDAAFASDGLAVIDLGGSETVEALVGGLWGESYLVGAIEREGESDGYIAKLSADGELDPSFGEGGVVRLRRAGAKVKLFGLRWLWDGLIAGGQSSAEGDMRALAVRLDHSGELQAEFGDGGVSSYQLQGELANDGASTHTPLGASRVFVTLSDAEGDAQVVAVAFDAAGAVEHERQLQIDVPAGSSDGVSASGARGRRIYVAGSTSAADDSSGTAYVARLGGQGLDESFGGGIVTAHFALEYAAFNALAVTRSGVTLAGYDFGESAASLPPSDAIVARYLSDGTLDARFGEGGVVHLDYQNGAAVCGPRVLVE
jgi:uncharacterized delta-60 repeat protein